MVQSATARANAKARSLDDVSPMGLASACNRKLPALLVVSALLVSGVRIVKLSAQVSSAVREDVRQAESVSAGKDFLVPTATNAALASTAIIAMLHAREM